MDLNLILPSNASGNIFPGNTLTAYRVLLQKYENLEVPHAVTLLSLIMPTRWSNIKRSEIYLVQVEKAAARPTYVRVHNRGGVSGGDVDDDDKRSGRSASGLRRGAKISKLRRLIETAARRRAGRCTGVKNNSEEAMTTYDFPNPVYVPLNTNYLKEVTIYLRDSFGDPIPFEYGEVVVLLGLRPIPPGLSGTLV